MVSSVSSRELEKYFFTLSGKFSYLFRSSHSESGFRRSLQRISGATFWGIREPFQKKVVKGFLEFSQESSLAKERRAEFPSGSGVNSKFQVWRV